MTTKNTCYYYDNILETNVCVSTNISVHLGILGLVTQSLGIVLYMVVQSYWGRVSPINFCVCSCQKKFTPPPQDSEFLLLAPLYVSWSVGFAYHMIVCFVWWAQLSSLFWVLLYLDGLVTIMHFTTLFFILPFSPFLRLQFMYSGTSNYRPVIRNTVLMTSSQLLIPLLIQDH